MIELRKYQEELIAIIHNKFSNNKKHLLVTAPTGSGKTVVFSELCKRVSLKNNKCLIFTNRKELLNQAGGSLQKVGLKPFLIEAGSKYYSKDAKVYVAMSQTFKNRVNDKYWIELVNSVDLFIIDECHLQDFNFLFETGLLKDKFVLGFTATPTRSGKQRQLALDYEDIVETVSVRDLIDMNFLNDCDYYGGEIPNLSAIGFDKMKGDYKEKEMFNAFNQSKLYAGVVRNWKLNCFGTKTLVFCCNIEHAVKTCQEFVDAGISAKFITSEVSKPQYPKHPNDGNIVIYNEKVESYELYCKSYLTMSGDRETLLDDFKRGIFTVLINASILTTGFDEPSIETIIVNRATMSLSLWLQMLGRGSRIFDGKNHFNILDFGGTQSRLGTYSQNRNWSLWHEESKGGGIAPIKLCGYDAQDRPITKERDGCKRYIHAGLNICPFCGYKYPVKVLKDVDLSLIAFSETDFVFKKFKPIARMSDKELAEYCKEKHHKTAWLWRMLYLRGGVELIEKQEWSEKTKESAKKYCESIASYI